MLSPSFFPDSVQLWVFISIPRSLREGIGKSLRVVGVSVRVVKRLPVLNFRFQVRVVDDILLTSCGSNASISEDSWNGPRQHFSDSCI